MLTLHQSNRLERLARQLAGLLGQSGATPLRAETVVVQHPGMARWLSLEIAAHLGICANLAFPLPAAFIWQAFRDLLPDVPAVDPYQPGRLAWRIHELLEAFDDNDLNRPLVDYLGDGDEVRRFQLAQQLAVLYDRYLMYRPEWVLAWESGRSAVKGDGWQAELWRHLSQQHPLHWVSLQQQYFSRMSADTEHGLPDRVFIFGVPTLSPGYLEIIRRLATLIDVHLFLLNPCEAHWAEIVSPKTQASLELAGTGAQLYLEVGNPLLASLGRQGRDFFAAINELDPGSEAQFEPAGGEGLLQRLQQQILMLETSDAVGRWDDSISFHLCHGPMREVEVLYDQLLALLEEVPGLTPSEIVVMTPEIDRYAPLIEAVFSEPGDRPAIPFRISDRSLQQGNPLAAALLEILQLPDSRYGVGGILSLLEIPAVQRCFDLDRAALASITDWVTGVAIRWGLDGESKRALGLPPESRNTWLAGLRRLLLGYAMPGDSETLWQGIVPFDTVEGSAGGRLGGLLAFCDAVFGLEQRLGAERTLAEWEVCLLDLIQRFFLPDEESANDADGLREVIHRLALEGLEAGFEGRVSLSLVRHRLRELLESSQTLGFLGGGVSFCALAPMRSLPFRVVCLLGMNDGVFPRRQPEFGFDLMRGEFRFGDRSRRADDRYLFLETLISARERLYISYVGRSQRDNSALPPSVVVDELRDTLRRMIGDDGLQAITRHHPLQPFSPDYFRDLPGIFSYSPQRREAAMRVGQGTAAEQPLLKSPLIGETGMETVTLEALIHFYVNPPRAFARERLMLNLEAAEALPDEREPFALERFDQLDLERCLVESLLRGESSDELSARIDAVGSLPHGHAGRSDFQSMLSRAAALSERVKEIQGDEPPKTLDLDLVLEGVRLSGVLHGVTEGGLLAYSSERLYPYQLLQYWIRHLLLNLSGPAGVNPSTRLLEGDRTGFLRPVHRPGECLSLLLRLYREGHNQPLPFYPATSWAYVEGLGRGDEEKAMERACTKWYGNRQISGDGGKPYNRLLWPQQSLFSPAFQTTAVEVLQPLIDHLEWS